MNHFSQRAFSGFLAVLLGWLAPAGQAQPGPASPGAGTIRDVLPDGWIVLDGDIGVPGDFFANRANYVTNLWPGGVVPFQFDVVSPEQQNVALAAMAAWEAVANVNFRPRELFDPNYVTLFVAPGEFNISLGIGMIPGGQNVFIFHWDLETVTHELGHVLGFWHEQQRSNRDQFIQIFSERIPDVEEFFNFSIVPGSRNYGPYDFLSIMHYPECAFSMCAAACPGDVENCRTMLIIDEDERALFQTVMGTVVQISEWDAQVMQWMYPPTNWRFVDRDHFGLELGTLIDPWNTLEEGVQTVPTGGIVWIMTPGTYTAPALFDRRMELRAPMGGVVVTR